MEKNKSDSEKSNSELNPKDYTIIEDFPESTHRARRNLLIFAIIALFYKLSGASPTGKFSFLGLELEHVDVSKIPLFLGGTVLYHLFHFAWLAFEHWKKNRILLTRMVEKDKRTQQTSWNEQEIDLSDSGWNLYGWWKKFREGETGFIEMFNKHSEIKDLIDPLRKIIDEKESYDSFKNQLYDYLQKMHSGLEGTEKTLLRLIEIEPRLQKFDKSYKKYSTSTRWRWWILETGLPASLGLVAFSIFLPSLIEMFF